MEAKPATREGASGMCHCEEGSSSVLKVGSASLKVLLGSRQAPPWINLCGWLMCQFGLGWKFVVEVSRWVVDSHEPGLGCPCSWVGELVFWELPDGDILQDVVFAVVILCPL